MFNIFLAAVNLLLGALNLGVYFSEGIRVNLVVGLVNFAVAAFCYAVWRWTRIED